MFRYKYKKGEMVQVIKPYSSIRLALLVSNRKIQTLEDSIWPERFYEGYTLELKKTKNGLYLPNEDAYIEWDENIKQKHLFPLEDYQKDSRDLTRCLDFMKHLEPEIKNVQPPFDPQVD